jgi:uncharacterized protein YbbC (DUF1343 family)
MLVGLDRLASAPELAAVRTELKGRRVGLLAHPASVDRRLVHARHVLASLGVNVAIVFGPEHGYGGEAQDMIGVADARDALGAPIRSLYGETFDALSPRPDDLSRIDILVVDLQDVGSRYYTFVWTAVLAMRACVRAPSPVKLIVLDRPNPIGGDRAHLEGRSPRSELCSFVGLEPIPVRHGLTLGAIVAWRAEVEKVPRGLLDVISVVGLAETRHATAWDRPFVMPSPNMPSYDTALVYPGGCLIEGTNLSEGRGTTRPFELVGAPFLDGARLAEDLNGLGLPGFRARPVTFLPMFQKHGGQVCGGVQVHVGDAAAFRPFATYLALVALARRQNPQAFAFRTEKYEFRDDVPAFDLLTGDAQVRERIARGEDALAIAQDAANLDARDHAIIDAALEARRVWSR